MNARDGRGTSPLAVAAGVGHCDVLKVLIEHPNARLNAQVNCCMDIRFCHVHAYIHMYVALRLVYQYYACS